MNKIILLTDYKGNYGSKWDAYPYRSGFNKKELEKCFARINYSAEYIKLSDIISSEIDNNIPMLYTSSEDIGYFYKSYIEDIILMLEQKGANIIPPYIYLRANNNKVFMELLRNITGHKWNDNLNSWTFGTYEEMMCKINEIKFPIVIKTAYGSSSKGVYLADNKEKLKKTVKNISRTRNIYQDIKDKLRAYKHKNYADESYYRKKFILQPFIPGLDSDWKILIWGDKYFVLNRHVRKGDFRASGSHNNYKAGSSVKLPDGLLEFANRIFESLNVPHLSIDICYDGVNYNLLEFQAVYFGTSAINMSDVYFIKKNGRWISENKRETVEKIYVESIEHYINNNISKNVLEK